MTTCETPLPCGYAPRAIHLAEDRSALFVGAKDGSIQGIAILSQDQGGTRYKPFQVPGKSRSGVRSLSEWQNGWLWVARRGGEVEVLDARGLLRERAGNIAEPLTLPLQGVEGDSARTIGRVDAERGFVSFQRSGTWVLPRHPLLEGDPAEVLRRAWADKIELRVENRPLSELHFIVSLVGLAEHCFVLANRRGELFLWDDQQGGEVERIDLWEEGEEPAFINHAALLWSGRQERKQARGVVLATDRGVYLIHAGGRALRRTRLALPRLGAVCMAITYAEPENTASPCYLWAADSRRDHHLYWGDRQQDPDRINFRPSGISRARHQSLLAVSWYHEEERCLMVGQVRRNNQVVIAEYCEVRHRSEPDTRKSQWILNRGNKNAIRSFWQDFDDPAIRKVKDWPLEAQLSELFEVLAEESSTPLLEFLADPSARTAWMILDGILRAPGSAERACDAVQLWTLSLLGVINRAGGDLDDAQLEAAYLGIIQWLRDLRQRAVSAGGRRKGSSTAGWEAVIRELDLSIGMVRKWGLFGDANSLRENLTLPLSVLRQQGQAEQDLDRLTYEVLLFERGLDLRAENRSGNLAGRNAWDIAGLELDERIFFGVSWHWGGVELFELRSAAQSQELELMIHLGIVPSERGRSSYRFDVRAGEEIATQIERSQYGHSRAILLTKLSTNDGEKTYLLTAPALPSGSAPERLMLWELVLDGDRLASRSQQPSSYMSMPNPEESVYSLLDLGNGFGIAGLRGTGGRASCLLFQVIDSAGSLALKRPSRLYINQRGEESGARSENRVWSLARADTKEDETVVYRVVLGCENGEILLLTLREDHQGLRDEWELVARMSSPIKALVCRRVDQLKGLPLRIVAGCADGSVVAWQELPPKEDTGENEPGSRSRNFSSLWAFYEGEEIAGLHLVDISEGSGNDQHTTPMVLAITRDEQCLLYNDLPKIADVPEPGECPCRIPVPGSRYGHFRRFRKAPPSAFASFLVPLPASAAEQDRETGRVAALLTASKHGVVRLLSVHYPHFHALRKEKYKEILRQWWNLIQNSYQLRLVHAVYRSAPSIELILVRWLLDPVRSGGSEREPAGIFDHPWKLPRNLRSLLRLRKALDERKEQEVYESLLTALREAFRLGDLDLFQEICEMLLRSGNFDLFAVAGQPGGRGPAARVYLQILEAIEQSLPQWQGSTNREENLARITVAKNLVDGDTFLRVLDVASKEAESQSDPHPFTDVLRHRIRSVRDLIVRRDPRVSLEALRAANLSLQRLCKRLTQRRGKNRAAEIAWDQIFEPYFLELTAAAARVFRSPLELNDALAHAFARTFALAVCACPSAAMRIATGMTESQLITDPDSQDDLCNLVPRQFQILEQLGIPVDQHAQELFRIASRPPDQGISPLQDEWLQRQDWGELGRENCHDLACLQRLYKLVSWFDDLEKKFSGRPEEIGAGWAKLEPLLTEVLADRDLEKLYRHSVGFWLWAVREFVRTLVEPEETEAPAEAHAVEWARLLARKLAGRDQDDPRIQPQTVLLSHKIRSWSAQMMVALRSRYDELRIFQPEYTIFHRLFDRLWRAADDFPNSAAVRMNVVQGVLGHHLLEDLDEHILELQEIAHVLDPPLVRRYRERRQVSEPDEPVAQSFAKYLMDRSERAESLPKNLRNLFSLLDRAHSGDGSRPNFHQLLETFIARDPKNREIDLGSIGAMNVETKEEFLSLRMILDELDHNDQKHTESGSSQVKVTAHLDRDLRPTLVFDFAFPLHPEEGDELAKLVSRATSNRSARPPRHNLARLRTLYENGLQSPIEPRPDRSVPSSGMGLYMANFAASIVRWKLEVALPPQAEDLRGRCVFHLTRCYSPGTTAGDTR